MPAIYQEIEMSNSRRALYTAAVCAFALTSFASTHYASAANWSGGESLSLQKSITLVSDDGTLPSQRPRYLSGSAGSVNSRFSNVNSGPNDWGLNPIPPTEGIVTLKPGETYRTAGNADLGARAAGATHGHALSPSDNGSSI